MLPPFLLGGVHAVRDQWTLGLTCEIQSAVYAPDGRGGQSVTWSSVGYFQCRIDAMESGTTPPNFIDTTKRAFGLTLPHDAPRLGIGWRVVVGDQPYLVEKAHDFDAEAVIRRYDVSITEAEWTSAAQDDTVRDDDWPLGTPDTNIAGVFGGEDETLATISATTAIDGVPGDQSTGVNFASVSGGDHFGMRIDFARPQLVGAIRAVFDGTEQFTLLVFGVPVGASYPAGLIPITQFEGLYDNSVQGVKDRYIPLPGGREWSEIAVRFGFDDSSGGSIYDFRAYDPNGEVID